MLTVEELDLTEVDHARLIADQHRDPVNGPKRVQDKQTFW